MKANELMIGDWVKTPLGIGKVTAIDAACLPGFQTTRVFHKKRQEYQDAFVDIDKVRPIPLTPEILEKNGFEKSHESLRHIKYRLAFNLDTEDEHWMFIQLHPANEKCNIDWARIEYFPSSRIDLNTIETKIVNCSVHHLQHALRLCGIEKEIEL